MGEFSGKRRLVADTWEVQQLGGSQFCFSVGTQLIGSGAQSMGSGIGDSEMDTASWHTGGPFLHANLTLHDFSFNLWLLNMYYATCEQQMEGPPLAVSIDHRRDQEEATCYARART